MSNFSMLTKQRQQGAVLIISLIILLVLTVLGITGMRTTVLEQKMAGNSFDRNTAFQAAEVALRDGEDLASTLVATGSFSGSNGRLGPSDSDPDWWDSATWDSASTTPGSIAYSGTLSDVKTQPRYIIKYKGQINLGGGSLKKMGYGEQNASTINQFRITARGTGKTDNSQVILQSYYGKNL